MGFDPEEFKRMTDEYKRQHPVPQRVPNPRNEQLTGSQQPRQVDPSGMIETGLESGGATAGAIRGAQLGARFGIPGALLGGALGGAAGILGTREAMELSKSFAGERPFPTMDEVAREGGRALLEGVAAEAPLRAYQGVKMGLQAGRRALLGGSLSPEAAATRADASRLGIHIPTTTLADKKGPQLIEQSLRRTVSGGESFAKMDVTNELNLRKGIDAFAERSYGVYAGEIEQSELIQRALRKEVIPVFQQAEKALYKELDAATGAAPIVQTTKTLERLSGIRASLEKRGNTRAVSVLDDAIAAISQRGPTTGMNVRRAERAAVPEQTIQSPIVQPSGKPFETTVPEQPSKLLGLKIDQVSEAQREAIPVSFSQAQQARSLIGEELGRGVDPIPDADAKQLRQAYAILSGDMAEAVLMYSKATGKDIMLKWRLADTMSRRGKELFNESIVKKAIEQDPEKVVRVAFKKEGITATRDLVRALDAHPDVLNQYRQAVVQSLIRDATNPATERVVGEKFASEARKRGTKVLVETFGETWPSFKRVLEVAEKLPSQKNSGMLWFEQGLYIHGLSALGVGAGVMMDRPELVIGAAAAPAAWFIGTRQLSKILTDPKLANKLIQIPQLDRKHHSFARLMSQLGAIEVGETGAPASPPRGPRQGFITTGSQLAQ